MTLKDEARCSFLVEYNMQGNLRDVCSALKIPKAYYKHNHVRVTNNELHYQYTAYVKSHLLGRSLWVGDYAADEEEAHEDVVEKVLSQLLFVTGKEIGDYNYYKVAKLEKDIKKLQQDYDKLAAENDALKLENGYLNDKVRLLSIEDIIG
ncbi:hypothetical protein SESBI_50163 [Sesbania bispinosa]|nr:hypothetical protein SESBI_50163 [Sesbania bispinosa]